ncbi:MAG TPA: phosphotransferase [Candidatus Dormibacteraeota bacterium]
MRAEELTRVLRASGALPRGEVLEVASRPTAAFNSDVTRLTLTYSEDATDEAPRHLVQKVSLKKDWATRAGAVEVSFYKQALKRELPMLAPCYLAYQDPQSGRSVLLLQDLSGSHEHPVTRRSLIDGHGVPTSTRLKAIVDSLADFHHAWRGRAALRTGLPEAHWLQGPTAFGRFADVCRKELDSFRRAVGDHVTEADWAACDAVVDSLRPVWARWLAKRGGRVSHLVLAHGDCYLSNWLVPRPEHSGSPTLIDFQHAHVDTPGEDLAFLLGTFWTSDQRAAHETVLLRRYHARLDAPGYSLEALLEDYRWSLVRMLTRTVWDHHNGSPEAYWRPKLRRVLSALRDHGVVYAPKLFV